MVARTALSAVVIGLLAFTGFCAGLRAGWDLDRVRNGVLLAMVLFENVQAGNSRSERLPVLRLSPLRNPLLLVGTAVALGVHVAALYVPGAAAVLRMQPAGVPEWAAAIAGALALAGAVDLEKRVRARLRGRPRTRAHPASGAAAPR